jgi:DivIVA domain-containing protein
MPLTPADIHNMEFKKSSLGKRGYDEEEVDALLDAVTGEMIQLMEENDALREQVHRTDASVTTRIVVPDGATEAEFAAVKDELNKARRAFGRADQNAHELRRRLEEARRPVVAEEPPPPGADRVLAMAQRTADQHLQAAQQEADEVLGDAREQSAQITQDGRLTARDITEGARRSDSDAAAELKTTRAALLHEIDELTEFAEKYRAALAGHIQHQEEITNS